jgi:peptidoglycan/LPS O-acetylase OafA/YrhL
MQNMHTSTITVLPISAGESIDSDETTGMVSVHRSDVTGLRGLAVLVVILFQLCGWPRGGFVGIDVLLVLSGYYTTYTILRTRSTSTFFTGRARKICPVLLIVVGVSAVAGPWLSDRPEVLVHHVPSVFCCCYSTSG